MESGKETELQCAIANTEYFEYFAGQVDRAGESGIMNPPDAVDGHLAPSMLPGWDAELDWSYIKKRTLAKF